MLAPSLAVGNNFTTLFLDLADEGDTVHLFAVVVSSGYSEWRDSE
jgi:hypothetical protein